MTEQVTPTFVWLQKHLEGVLHGSEFEPDSMRRALLTLRLAQMGGHGSVQFQDITRQQIEIVANALNQLDEHAATLAQRIKSVDDPDFQYTPLTARLDDLYDKYVMETQRTSHQRALGQAGKTETPQANTGSAKIELF